MAEFPEIVKSTRSYCGVVPTDDLFDKDLIPLIKSELTTINQLGAGVVGFPLTVQSTWTDFIPDDPTTRALAEELVHIRVRLSFDPPSSSFVAEALKEKARELTWRLNVNVDEPFPYE